ncbi:hypothetical protein FCJ57_06220 [Burkholderia diffusa]|nr:hypothetical protein [Burkholderia diffusa]
MFFGRHRRSPVYAASRRRGMLQVRNGWRRPRARCGAAPIADAPRQMPAALIHSSWCGAILIRTILLTQVTPTIPSTRPGNTPDSNSFIIFYGKRDQIKRGGNRLRAI